MASGQDRSQAVSQKDGSDSAFGCGSIDIRGNGPSGPTDMGGMVSILSLLALSFIMRWRKYVGARRCLARILS